MGTSSSQKRGHSSHPIFPCLLWSNGWMDQDATWYGGKSRPSRRCFRWGRSSPIKGAQPQFSVHVYLWPNGWMKTPLGTGVDLGPGRILLDGDTAHPRKRHSSPSSFRPMSIVATVAHISYTAELVFRVAQLTAKRPYTL